MHFLFIFFLLIPKAQAELVLINPLSPDASRTEIKAQGSLTENSFGLATNIKYARKRGKDIYLMSEDSASNNQSSSLLVTGKNEYYRTSSNYNFGLLMMAATAASSRYAIAAGGIGRLFSERFKAEVGVGGARAFRKEKSIRPLVEAAVLYQYPLENSAQAAFGYQAFMPVVHMINVELNFPVQSSLKFAVSGSMKYFPLNESNRSSYFVGFGFHYQNLSLLDSPEAF